MKNYLSLVALAITCLFSCDIINPEEQIPVYVTIEAFEMEDNISLDEGSLDFKVQEAFVFAGPNNLGIFTLPATIPILESGEFEIDVDPIVRANGSSFFLRSYPFYERYTQVVDLQPGDETLVIQPVTRYKDNTIIAFEAFDDSNLIFSDNRDADEETVLEFQTDDVFEGAGAGIIKLDQAHSTIEVATSPNNPYNLGQASFMYLELNYKTDIPFLMGLVAQNGGESFSKYQYGVNTKDEWNKIYFDISDEVVLSGLDQFQIGIFSSLPIENGAFTIDSAEILLDNIKLVYF